MAALTCISCNTAPIKPQPVKVGSISFELTLHEVYAEHYPCITNVTVLPIDADIKDIVMLDVYSPTHYVDAITIDYQSILLTPTCCI